MITQNYIEQIFPLIEDMVKEKINIHSVKELDLKNEEIKEELIDIIGGIHIVVEKDTKLDVGEDTSKIEDLGEVIGEELTFLVDDIYDRDVYSDDDFIVESKGQFFINPEYDDGVLADTISDSTDFLVDTVYYHLT